MEKGSNSAALSGTKVLVLMDDREMATRLHELLFAIGVECWVAHCLAGASALLRRDEHLNGQADFLIADPNFGHLSADSLCAALMLPLKRRPAILLALTPGSAPPEVDDCIDAIVHLDLTATELENLMLQLRPKWRQPQPDREAEAG